LRRARLIKLQYARGIRLINHSENHGNNQKADIFKDLSPHAVLVTPNRRLSATLLKQYNQFQFEQKKLSWPTLNVLPLNSWMDQLWKEYGINTVDQSIRLLTPEEELFIWEKIIKQTPMNDLLLQVAGTALIAKSAWSTLKQWRVSIHHPHFQLTEDSQAFKLWAIEFEKQCALKRWLDIYSIIDRICEKIISSDIPLPDELFFIGFTELSPQQHYFITCCERKGSKVQLIETMKTVQDATAVRLKFPNVDSELIAMARWAHTLTKKTKNSAQLIGCIIPNLEKNRDTVLRIFSQVFSSVDNYTQDYTTLPFNISAGKSLSLYPIIHMALELLSAPTHPLPIEKLSALLLSPFLGDAENERSSRALLDIHLRNANITSLTLTKLLHFKNNCPKLFTRLEKGIDLLKNNQKRGASEWTLLFMDYLNNLGWPGERSLNSLEYQMTERFLEVLNTFQTYDEFLTEVDYADALHYLKRLTHKTIYQPETSDAPVQILGLLEAAGLAFDHAWVLGLDDMTWPQPAKPNPFIPISLQKELHMPHATHSRELSYSMQLTHQLKQSANTIIFSYAEYDNQSELRPSRLILDVPDISFENLNSHPYTTPAEIIFNNRCTEYYYDEKGPAIESLESIRGGVAILKKQAACPFKAFAEIRLSAYPLKTPTLGLSALDRGVILHKALELIWQCMTDSTQLSRLDADALNNLIDDCIDQSFQQTAKINLNPSYVTFEKKRLHKTLWNWLQFEKTRPFFKVIAREIEFKTEINPLTFTLRLDRMDELEDGSHFIIDYKTGKYNSIRQWFSDRPEEPQLPLYCISNTHNKIGIAFAEIQGNPIGFQGISKRDLSLKNIKLVHDVIENGTWESQIEVWNNTFKKIMDDFLQGNASVDPKNKNETCRLCDLQSFCRVYEL